MRLILLGLLFAGALLYFDQGSPEPRDSIVECGASAPLSSATLIQEFSPAESVKSQSQSPTLQFPASPESLASYATDLADTDPFAAVNLLLTSVPGGQLQQNAALGIFQRLAFQNPALAQTWLDRFPEDLRPRFRSELDRIKQRQTALQSFDQPQP